MKALLITSLILFLNLLLFAQDDLYIERIGHNEIFVSNRNNHSISVSISGQKKVILPRGFGYHTYFSLNAYNVHNRAFNVSYDEDCYKLDIMFCDDAAYRRGLQAERNKNAFYLLAQYLKGNLSLGRVIVVLAANGFINDVTGDEKRTIEAELTTIFLSGASYEEKEIMANAVLQKFLKDKNEEIMADQDNCHKRAENLLNGFKPRNYYASKFIDVLEKSHFELSPFVTVGFVLNQFKEEVNSNPAKSSFNAHPPVGFRLAYNYASYDKNHRRKSAIRHYLPLYFMQSPAVYRLPGSGNFPSDTALSWKFLSVGYGIEYQHQYTKRGESLASIQLDFGLTTSVFNNHTYKNKSLGSTKQVSSFDGVAPYFNIGYKERLFNWLEIYLSYYNTSFLFNLTNKAKDKDMPGFRQFNLGLNINLGRHYSYQY